MIITKNEERNISRCIESLTWADQILVYDSGSTDKTIEIAKNMGAKVIEASWEGFGPTKRKASESADFDWILSVDADEAIPTPLQKEIRDVINQSSEDIAYKVPRISFYLNRWIKHGGWYPDYQIRLFNRKKSGWNKEPIHEKVEAKKVEALKNPMEHYVFKNIAHQVETNNRYSGLQAEKMHKEGKQFSYFHFLTKPYVKFIECYIFKLGLLDGWAGYLIARNAAYSVLLKWMKLKEIESQKKG